MAQMDAISIKTYGSIYQPNNAKIGNTKIGNAKIGNSKTAKKPELKMPVGPKANRHPSPSNKASGTRVGAASKSFLARAS